MVYFARHPPTLMNLKNSRKYAAEMLGVFTLTLAVSLSLLFVFPLSTPVLAALVVGIFVYMVGPISGAHLNPAVTLGMWCIKQIGSRDAILYVASQIIGAGLATMLVLAMTATKPPLIANETMATLLAEAVGTFFLAFAVAGVSMGKVDDDAAGLVIGGSLLLGAIIASTMSNGILNPAVAFGLGSLKLSYLLGPLLGGSIGAIVFSWMGDSK